MEQNELMTTYETVTPDVARDYLKLNIRNRKLNRREIESIARDIVRGKYVVTHQGIAFDRDGHLVDGQQRLQSIVLANKPVKLQVTRGLSAEAVLAIDRGTTRSVSDAVRISNSITSASGAEVLLEDQKLVSALNSIIMYIKTIVDLPPQT